MKPSPNSSRDAALLQSGAVNGKTLLSRRSEELFDHRTVLMPLTVEQYHRMIDQGIVPEGEPYELLDGHLVRKDRSAAGDDPMTVGPDHVLVVKRLARLSRKLERLGCHLQTQQPVSLPPHDEPEPDAAVVLGSEDDYVGRLPTAAEVPCVIEVADSSLRRDRSTKLRIYADSGIAVYVIVNLLERLVEVYSQPLTGKGRYGRSVTLAPGQSLELPTTKGRRLAVPVRSLLP